MAFTLNKKTVYSLFIAFIMLSSIFAFVLIFAGPQAPQPPVQPPAQPPETTIDFQAENVQAKVVRLFPTIIVTSPTNEATIGNINLEIQKITGVNRILNAYYANLTGQTDFSLTYVAEVSIAENADTQIISQKITEILSLSSPEVLRAGLVSLPASVVFENPDLNITQPHTFSSPLSNAYLSIGTLPDDDVKVFIQASFAASTLRSIQSFETENTTGAPENISLSSTLPIDSLGQKLFASFFGAGQSIGTADQIEAETLEAVSTATDISATEDFFLPVIEITLDKNYSTFEPDFDTALQDFNGVQAHFLNLDQNKLTVVLDTQNFVQTKQAVIAELNSLNFAVVSSTDPTVPFTLEAAFESNELAEQSTRLQTFLSSKGFTEISVTQNAFFSVQKLQEANPDMNYSFSQETFEGQIKPTHAQGEQVELDISLAVARNIATSISAREQEPSEPEPQTH